MNITKGLKKHMGILEIVVVVLGVLFVLIPTSPINMPLAYRDSGVFLYTGQRILQGETPYLDVWDHKPPVIYYLNALGLLLGGGTRWGVWGIELISLFLASLIGYNLVKKTFGVFPSILTLYLWLLSLTSLIQGGNLTSEYALPLQFACLWLAYDANKHGFFSWRGFLIGVFTSVLFFTKQNLVGVGLAIILYLVVSRSNNRLFKKLSSELLIIFLGGLSFLLIICCFLGIQGALPDFWDAAFSYNFSYSSSSIKSRILAIIKGVETISTTYLVPFAFIGWVAGLVMVIFHRDAQNRALKSMIIIGLINLPIEFIFVSISGRGYPHYYIALLPILSFFSGLAFWFFIKCISGKYATGRPQLLFTICILSIFSLSHARGYIDTVRRFRQVRHNSDLVAYIKKSTTDDDLVLFWGAEAGINFFSGRRSPSRFVYQYPLYQPGYTSEKMIEEFLDDLIQGKPSLIVDTQNPQTPFGDFEVTSDKIVEYWDRIISNYSKKETLGSWTVYEYEVKPGNE